MKNDERHIKLGRPLLYDDPEVLHDACEGYFNKCYEEGTPYSIAGLCNHVGMTKNSLWDYEQREEFSDTVKLAKQIIEESYNVECLTGDDQRRRVGHIFMLKACFKYREGQDFNVGGQEGNPLQITQSVVSPIEPIDMRPAEE